jgi:hypothetical protein
MRNHTEQIFNELEDVTIAAFLALRGHIVTPLRYPDGRRVFEVQGDIARDVEAFYTNQPVGIMDIVSSLKWIQGQILP